MLEELYKIFGDTLPEKNVFFATQGAPTRAPFLKEFGSWVEFCNDYMRFVAVKRAAVAPETIVPAKGATKDAK